MSFNTHPKTFAPLLLCSFATKSKARPSRYPIDKNMVWSCAGLTPTQMPKTMYSLLFWGLVLPLLVLPSVIGWAMVCFAAWMLGRYNATFRIASIAAGLRLVVGLFGRFLPHSPYLGPLLLTVNTLLTCLLGWYLLTAVAKDCLSHGHLDVAANARIGRIIFLLVTVASTLCFYLLPLRHDAWALLQLIIPVLGYVVLIWTVQSAKIRLFP